MVRLFKCLAFVITGVLAGAILGIMLGMTYMEFAQHGCAGAACGDLIARSFMPGGALAGGITGLIAARPRERLNRF